MEKPKQSFLYYVYAVLLVLIIWLVFKLYNIYVQDHDQQHVSHHFFSDDTFTVFVNQIPETFNPYTAVYDEEIFIIKQIFRGLTRLNANLVEIPDLAAYWDISQDKKEYIFTLRDDIYFQDDTPVLAEDFVNSVKFFLRNYPRNYTISYFKVVKGVEDFVAGREKEISGFEILSEKKIKISLMKPYLPFTKLLSLPQMVILPEQHRRANSFKNGKRLIGTGPYRLTSSQNNNISLKAFRKNMHYDPKITNIKLVEYDPLDKEVVSKFFEEKFDLSLVFSDSFLNRDSGLKFRKNVSFSLIFAGFNCIKPPTDNIWVRKALFFAFDPEYLTKKYYRYDEAAEFISPIFLRDDPQFSHLLTSNLSKSRDILFNTGYDSTFVNNPVISFALDTVAYYTVFDSQFNAIGDSLGFKITPDYINGLEMDSQMQILDSHNAFIFDWEIDLPDPEFFFELLFRSESPMNLFNYRNAKVDSLLELAKYSDNSSERLEYYAEVEDIVFREAPMRPLLYLQNFLFYQDYVEDAILSKLGVASLRLDKISVNPDKYRDGNWRLK